MDESECVARGGQGSSLPPPSPRDLKMTLVYADIADRKVGDDLQLAPPARDRHRPILLRKPVVHHDRADLVGDADASRACTEDDDALVVRPGARERGAHPGEHRRDGDPAGALDAMPSAPQSRMPRITSASD